MKNNQIQKAQFGKILKKMWNTLSNATQVAQIAESPSVMTASGWRVDRNGKAVQDQQNNPTVKQLRDNLATIGEAAIAAPTAVKDVELAYQAVRHPVQTARAVKSAATQAAKATKQLVSKGKNAVQRFKQRRNLIGKANWSNTNGTISKSDPRNAVLGPTDLYPDFSKMTRAEKIQYLKTQQELAERVDQARNLDALRMTKDRLKNGGFERLEQSMIDDANNISFDILTLSKTNPPLSEGAEDMIYNNIFNNKANILKAKPTKGTAKEVQIKTKDNMPLHSEDAGTGVFDRYFAWFSDAPQKVAGLAKGNKGVAHEFTHYFYYPFRRPKGFNPKSGTLSEYFYFTNPTSQEVAARGTQLKNYFGLKEGEQLTPEMYKYATRHYTSDVADNAMTRFFKSGNSNSPNNSLFLQWLNRNAPVIGGITTEGLTYNALDYE